MLVLLLEPRVFPKQPRPCRVRPADSTYGIMYIVVIVVIVY